MRKHLTLLRKNTNIEGRLFNEPLYDVPEDFVKHAKAILVRRAEPGPLFGKQTVATKTRCIINAGEEFRAFNLARRYSLESFCRPRADVSILFRDGLSPRYRNSVCGQGFMRVLFVLTLEERMIGLVSKSS